MADGALQFPHKLTLDQRKLLTMTGVTEVISVDEETVVLRTGLGTLIVHGQQLQLKNLSLEGGQLTVDGIVSGLIYEEPKPSGGFWRRLLG